MKSKEKTAPDPGKPKSQSITPLAAPTTGKAVRNDTLTREGSAIFLHAGELVVFSGHFVDPTGRDRPPDDCTGTRGKWN